MTSNLDKLLAQVSAEFEDYEDELDLTEDMCQVQQSLANQIKSAVDAKLPVLAIGPGGTGKTTTIRSIKFPFAEVAFVTPTGRAAVELGGDAATIHSYFGIPPLYTDRREGPTDEELEAYIRDVLPKAKYIKQNKGKRKNIKKVLIMEEISMVSAETLICVDCILRMAHDKNLVFGGVRIVLMGDPYQLPPVKGKWFFDCDLYRGLNFQKVEFDRGLRYESEDEFQIMLKIRKGHIDEEVLTALNARYQAFKNGEHRNLEFPPTCLLSLRRDVSAINARRMAALETTERTYTAEDTVVMIKVTGIDAKSSNSKYADPEVVRKYQAAKKQIENKMRSAKDELLPETLTLKVGCHVLFCRNYNTAAGHANGVKAVVRALMEDYVEVITERNIVVQVSRMELTITTAEYEVRRKQFPFKLGYAITIHGSQGMTLAAVLTEFENVFLPGQSYVAISRIRRLANIFIIHEVFAKHIRADPKVLAEFP